MNTEHNLGSTDHLIHFQVPPGSVNLGKFLQTFELKKQSSLVSYLLILGEEKHRRSLAQG